MERSKLGIQRDFRGTQDQSRKVCNSDLEVAASVIDSNIEEQNEKKSLDIKSLEVVTRCRSLWRG